MDLYFSALDELIQIIYQGSAKFVLMSRVDYNSWTVHLGLSGPEGRWWRGRWTDEKVKVIAGHKPSEDALEVFGGRLANTIVANDLMIGNWSPEKGTEINLTLGLSSKKPMTIDLTELSPSDAAAFATKEFISIALEAQSRKCRLNPPTVGLPPLDSSYPVKVSALNKCRTPSQRSVEPVSAPAAESSDSRHEPLKDKEDNSDQTPAKRPHVSPNSGSKPVSTEPARKGTQQPKTRGPGVPNKRARKVKAMEFGSDDD